MPLEPDRERRYCNYQSAHHQHTWTSVDEEFLCPGISAASLRDAGVDTSRPSDSVSRIARAASPDAPKGEGERRTGLEHRFDLIDSPALFEMTHVLYTGEKKYGRDNWRRIPVESHLNHLIAHAYAYLSGNRDDNHLANIMCNAMFACAVDLRPDFFGEAPE